MNVFANAKLKANSGDSKKSASKDNIRVVAKISDQIDKFVDISKKLKDIEAGKKLIQEHLTTAALQVWFEEYRDTNKVPPTLKFKGKESVITLIVQDRGERYALSDDQVELLKSLIGEEEIEGITMERTEYSFDNKILSKPGVASALSEAVEKMMEDGLLNAEEAGELIKANTIRTVRKGSIDRLRTLANGDVKKMASIVEALGSSVSAYVKP